MIIINKIDKMKKVVAEIENFEACYKTCVLIGYGHDGNIRSEDILTWLIENQHMAALAQDIAKLEREI